MKGIKALLLIIFFAFEQSTYSINEFLNYLQENGYYEIIHQIKIYYGDDVAISFCQGLVETGDCETVVKVYMTKYQMPSQDHHHPIFIIDPKEFDEIMKNLPKEIEYDIRQLLDKYKNFEEIIAFIKMMAKYYNTLIKEKKEKEILDLIKKMSEQIYRTIYNVKMIKDYTY